MNAKAHYHSEMKRVYKSHLTYAIGLSREYLNERTDFVKHGLKSLGLEPSQFKGKSVLDLGTGRGPYLDIMQEYGANAIGADIIPLRTDVKSVDWDKLPFDDHQFDIITLGKVFSVAHNPMQLASEISRVLKPGGMIIVEDVNDITFGHKAIKNLLDQKKISESDANKIVAETRLPMALDEDKARKIAKLSHHFVKYWLKKAGLKGESNEKYFLSQEGNMAPIFFMKYQSS